MVKKIIIGVLFTTFLIPLWAEEIHLGSFMFRNGNNNLYEFQEANVFLLGDDDSIVIQLYGLDVYFSQEEVFSFYFTKSHIQKLADSIKKFNSWYHLATKNKDIVDKDITLISDIIYKGIDERKKVGTIRVRFYSFNETMHYLELYILEDDIYTIFNRTMAGAIYLDQEDIGRLSTLINPSKIQKKKEHMGKLYQ